MVQYDKTFCPSHPISYDCHLWYTFVKCLISSYTFIIIFSKFWFFWVHRVVKERKTVQNDKKFCLSCSISQEPYIIWLSFMVQMYKIKTSPGVFLNFKILIFLVVRGLKWQTCPKMTKISICCTLYFRNHVSYDLHLWYTCFV